MKRFLSSLFLLSVVSISVVYSEFKLKPQQVTQQSYFEHNLNYDRNPNYTVVVGLPNQELTKLTAL